MAYRGLDEPVSQVMQSMENLDVSSMRPDIKVARDANAGIKAKLVYRDEEELDTGVQKVQPLPFLDEEIQKYHAQIRESVAGAQRVNDSVPSDVLQRVDRATMEAKEGMTSLFKASQLLELTFDAYQYARGAAQNTFDLKRKSERHLAEFEQSFKNVIYYRVKAELPQAEAEFDKCQEMLECALEESRRDVQSQEARAQDEDAVVHEASLQESHEQVQDMVKMERSELNLIGEQCLKDMRSIDEELRSLKRHMDLARQQYMQEDGKRTKRLQDNREEQRRLEERLRLLREEEERLKRDGQTGVELQRDAEAALSSTERDISQWRSRIEGLKKRTDTSLSVMRCMEECTDIIMADAKKKKVHWRERLKHLAVESCWILREGLLAKGAATMMVLEDNKNNALESKKLIASLEKDKMAAAQRGFIPRVNDIMRSIEQYTTARSACEEKIAQSSEVIKQIREELVSLDEKLHALRPELKLDTLENRYDELNQKKLRVFSTCSTEGVTFTFYHKLAR